MWSETYQIRAFIRWSFQLLSFPWSHHHSGYDVSKRVGKVKGGTNKELDGMVGRQICSWFRNKNLDLGDSQGIALLPWLGRYVTCHVTAKIRFFSSCHVTWQKRKSSRHWLLRYVTPYLKLLIVRWLTRPWIQQANSGCPKKLKHWVIRGYSASLHL